LFAFSFAYPSRRSSFEDIVSAADTDFGAAFTERQYRKCPEDVGSEVLHFAADFFSERVSFQRREEDHPHKSYSEEIHHEPGKPVHSFSPRKLSEFQLRDVVENDGVVS